MLPYRYGLAVSTKAKAADGPLAQGSNQVAIRYQSDTDPESTPAFPWPTTDPSAPPTGVEPRFAIVDQLRLPGGLEPGHWVLGWRWDAEETAQIWAACADVTIV